MFPAEVIPAPSKTHESSHLSESLGNQQEGREVPRQGGWEHSPLCTACPDVLQVNFMLPSQLQCTPGSQHCSGTGFWVSSLDHSIQDFLNSRVQVRKLSCQPRERSQSKLGPSSRFCPQHLGRGRTGWGGGKGVWKKSTLTTAVGVAMKTEASSTGNSQGHQQGMRESSLLAPSTHTDA